MIKSLNRRIIFILLFFLGTGIVGFAQTPKRIISLAPSITKELVLLELEDEICGITNYCKIPNKEKYAIVASAVDVNLEKVITLKPDLVLATSLSKPESLDILRNAGINVQYLKLPSSYAEINSQFIELGKMCGKEEKAKEIVSQQEAKIEQLLKRIDGKNKVRIFFEIGTNPLWCVIPNTFMNDFITMAGGQNIADDLSMGSISRESVIIRNPEIIIIATMGNVGEDEAKIWNSYANLSAVKNNRILIIDSDKSCSPTPVHFVETLEEIVNFIYKSE